jgi:hypothetical protein
LNQKDPYWKTQNSNCSNITVCPFVTLDPNTLNLHIPNLSYNNLKLSANLKFVQRDNKILFEVIDYSINSDSCASANLYPDFKLHIPTLMFGTNKLWADLQPYSTNDNKIIFELVKYGDT